MPKNNDGLLNLVFNIDCLELLSKIEDESIDLIATDPPYNLSYNGRGKINSFNCFLNDSLTSEEHGIWFDTVLRELHRVLKQDSAIYVFTDYRKYPMFYVLMEQYFNIKNCIVWDKMSIGMGQQYRFQHEFIIYAIKGKAKLNIDKRNVSDIWHIKRDNVRKYKHPTQKPLELFDRIIKYSSKKGDIVLDPFVGSGTSAVSAFSNSRYFIGSDVDKNYCEVAVERLKENGYTDDVYNLDTEQKNYEETIEYGEDGE